MPDISRKVTAQESNKGWIGASLRISSGRIPLTFTA
jgi:hypothetical protein